MQSTDIDDGINMAAIMPVDNGLLVYSFTLLTVWVCASSSALIQIVFPQSCLIMKPHYTHERSSCQLATSEMGMQQSI